MIDEAQHQDGYPWTWEPAALTGILLSIIGILALQIGRSSALLITGAGAWWPDTQFVVTSSWAILTGDTTAGLPTHTAADTPMWLVWTMTAVAAAIMCGGCGWAVWHLRGGTVKGMATTHQANHLLGLRRLRKTRSLIRPDLYPGRRR